MSPPGGGAMAPSREAAAKTRDGLMLEVRAWAAEAARGGALKNNHPARSAASQDGEACARGDWLQSVRQSVQSTSRRPTRVSRRGFVAVLGPPACIGQSRHDGRGVCDDDPPSSHHRASRRPPEAAAGYHLTSSRRPLAQHSGIAAACPRHPCLRSPGLTRFASVNQRSLHGTRTLVSSSVARSHWIVPETPPGAIARDSHEKACPFVLGVPWTTAATRHGTGATRQAFATQRARNEEDVAALFERSSTPGRSVWC